MSLKKFEMEETSVLHLRDANDEPMYADGADGQPDLAKPMRAHLYGPGTKQYAKAQAARQIYMVERLKKGKKADATGMQAVREQAEFLAACTKDLENVASDSGVSGQALFIEVYENLKLTFIPTQIGVYINETANFTQGSTKP